MPRRLTLMLVIEAITLSILRLAADVRFDWFAFFDGGAELTVHALMGRGLRPTIDFGYIYGLLPLGLGEVWYRLAGRSPGAFATACTLGNVLTAWGLARMLSALRAGPAGVAWVVVAMPFGLINSASPSMTHVLERAILTHGLADLAEGRRSRALGLAALCVFVKPSMAFLFGAAVIACQFLVLRPHTRRELLSLLAPGGIVMFVAAISLGLAFGSEVLINTVLPRNGYAVYRENHFGFFRGVGRAFWLPDRPRLTYYLQTEAGLWLAANGLLLLAALVQLSGVRRATAMAEERVSSGAEVVVVCALLHSAFLGFFFGNRWSWVYYFNILTVGVAAVSTRSRVGAFGVGMLTILALPVATMSLRGPVEAWQDRSRSAVTWGLWASPSVRNEWQAALLETRDMRPALLATTDGAALLQADFSPPEIAFLVRGHLRPGEMARKLAQIRAAAAVIVANPAPGDPWFDEWPEFAEALAKHHLVMSCPRLRIYIRDLASRSSSKNSR